MSSFNCVLLRHCKDPQILLNRLSSRYSDPSRGCYLINKSWESPKVACSCSVPLRYKSLISSGWLQGSCWSLEPVAVLFPTEITSPWLRLILRRQVRLGLTPPRSWRFVGSSTSMVLLGYCLQRATRWSAANPCTSNNLHFCCSGVESPVIWGFHGRWIPMLCVHRSAGAAWTSWMPILAEWLLHVGFLF